MEMSILTESILLVGGAIFIRAKCTGADRERKKDWKNFFQGAVEQPGRTYTHGRSRTTEPQCTFVRI